MKNKLTFIQRLKACYNLLFYGKYADNSDILDSQDFYELMQQYRHIPITDQHNVTKAFNDVKAYIRKFIK